MSRKKTTLDKVTTSRRASPAIAVVSRQRNIHLRATNLTSKFRIILRDFILTHTRIRPFVMALTAAKSIEIELWKSIYSRNNGDALSGGGLAELGDYLFSKRFRLLSFI